eukprot:3654098-Rhodomonas_salina.1
MPSKYLHRVLLLHIRVPLPFPGPDSITLTPGPMPRLPTLVHPLHPPFCKSALRRPPDMSEAPLKTYLSSVTSGLSHCYY